MAAVDYVGLHIFDKVTLADGRESELGESPFTGGE